jgi:hypothetical protein
LARSGVDFFEYHWIYLSTGTNYSTETPSAAAFKQVLRTFAKRVIVARPDAAVDIPDAQAEEGESGDGH